MRLDVLLIVLTEQVKWILKFDGQCNERKNQIRDKKILILRGMMLNDNQRPMESSTSMISPYWKAMSSHSRGSM